MQRLLIGVVGLWVLNGAAGQIEKEAYLASEGVVFERAYSNSSWTLPSTASFMTSLQTSVTGAFTAAAAPTLCLPKP